MGEQFAATGTQEKHYLSTYESDGETGSDYAVNRQFYQAVGRFARVDPFKGSNNTNPQSLNRYSYVQNDPINADDPVGLFPIIDLGGGSFAYGICFSFGEAVWCEWRIYNEYRPPAQKPPPPCPRSYKAPLTRKRLTTYDAQRDIVRDKLQNSDQCKTYLNEHGIDPNKALSAVNLQNAYDGPNSEISRLEAGLVSPDVDLTNPRIAQIENSCVSADFKNPRRTVGATTAIWPGQQPSSETTVEERSDVYYGKDISASNILHEALHSLLGVGDDGLANKLNITLPSNGSTQIISDELHKHGCGGD